MSTLLHIKQRSVCFSWAQAYVRLPRKQSCVKSQGKVGVICAWMIKYEFVWLLPTAWASTHGCIWIIVFSQVQYCQSLKQTQKKCAFRYHTISGPDPIGRLECTIIYTWSATFQFLGFYDTRQIKLYSHFEQTKYQKCLELILTLTIQLNAIRYWLMTSMQKQIIIVGRIYEAVLQY